MSLPAGRRRKAILVFSRAPVPGAAKRRLIPALGPAGAARLQRRMTRHIVEQSLRSRVGSVQLWGTPDCRHPMFRALGRAFPLTLHDQRDGDLGARMHGALAHALADHPGGAVLVGSDCPELTARDLREAAAALDEVPLVLGAAVDGGYVLIGLRAPAPVLFCGIPWGTPAVLAATTARAEGVGLDYVTLGPFHDIDRPADLARLAPTGRDFARAGETERSGK